MKSFITLVPDLDPSCLTPMLFQIAYLKKVILKNIFGLQKIIKNYYPACEEKNHIARLHSAVGNVSDCRYVSDCRSRGHKFDPGPVPYFCGD